MFEAKLANASLLRKIIDVIKGLVVDPVFVCSKSAMCLQAMDRSYVTLIYLKMEAELFDCYRCDHPINLGMSLTDIQKALKCADSDDSWMLRFDDSDEDSITFIFSDPINSCSQTVKVRRNIDILPLEIPDQEYSFVCEMPSSKLEKTCKDLAMFSDTLHITATKARITFTCIGASGSSTVQFNANSSADDENASVTIDVKPVNIKVSIKYMNQFTKATSLSSRVRIRLSNDVPVVIEYPIEHAASLRYYLAPKVG